MTIGEKIKALRKQKGLTQEELGDLLGVKKAAIQKYENGTVKNLKQDTIKKLSKIFNVNPIHFIEVEPIRKQVEILYEIKEIYGNDAVELLEDFMLLDNEGRTKVSIYVKDMVKIYG